MFSEEQLERYSRQFVLKEIGASGQKKLRRARVLVIGAGALGSPSLLYLAAAGVGTLGVADFDRVELSNLHRQIVHRTETVGMEKTLSVRQTINSLNPDVDVVCHTLRVTPENILSLIEPYDFIVDGADSLFTKLLINDACVLAKKPFVHAGVVRFGGQMMTYVPGQGPCLRCLLGDHPPLSQPQACSQVGVLGAATGVMGSMEALEAIKFLVGSGELLTGRILFFRGLTSRFDTLEFEANEDCPLCGTHPAICNLTVRRQDYEDPRSCRIVREA